MTADAVLVDRPLFPPDELAALTEQATQAGAVVSFTGCVRPHAGNGLAIRSLFLEHHPRLTARSLETIALATKSRFDVQLVRIVHRCGLMRPGEPIVFVAAASEHRRAAFQAVDYAMDRLKSEAIFWKREDYAEGSAWIEPTQADARDLARWSR